VLFARTVKSSEWECGFQIDETFRVPEVGTVIGGLLTKGIIPEGTKLQIGLFNDGCFTPVVVQSIHRNEAPCIKLFVYFHLF
jgi:GTPase